jgi:hypothetical protein
VIAKITATLIGLIVSAFMLGIGTANADCSCSYGGYTGNSCASS